jgi:TolB protein
MNTSSRVGLAAVVVAVGLQQSGSSAAAEVDGEARQASERIAYSTHDRVIYTSAPDGTDRRLIVRGGSDPVWSPDGRWIAYVGGRQSLWRVRADGTSNRRIPVGRNWTVSDPAWSPDGRRLAFTREWAVKLPDRFQNRYGVYTTGRDGKRTRRLHFGTMPTWSPDGRLIAFRSNGRSLNSHVGLAVVEPDGDGYRLLRDDVDPWFPAFAPDRQWLVFEDYSEASRLSTLNLRTGTLRNIPEGGLGGESATWTPHGQRIAYLAVAQEQGGGIVPGVELRTVRPDGTGRIRVATLPAEVFTSGGLSWRSEDG